MQNGDSTGTVTPNRIGQLDIIVAGDVQPVRYDITRAFFRKNSGEERARILVGKFLCAQRQRAGQRDTTLQKVFLCISKSESVVVLTVEMTGQSIMKKHVKIYHYSTSTEWHHQGLPPLAGPFQAARSACRIPNH